MNNNEIKKEEKEVVNDTKKIIKLKSVNLDLNQLVYTDSKIADLSMKSFDDMTDEELQQLTLCKAKVIKVDRIDKFTGAKTTNYKALLKICDDIILEKYLNSNDVLSIQNFNPELITDGKAQIYVPVKLVSMIGKDGNTRKFNYTACLSNNVYMGTTKKESFGYFNKGILENIIAYNLKHKSNKDLQVKFVDVDYESYANKRIVIEERDNEEDNF